MHNCVPARNILLVLSIQLIDLHQTFQTPLNILCISQNFMLVPKLQSQFPIS